MPIAAVRATMPADEIERWCEIVAAMKVRTTNKKGRHLSTVRTLQLLVEHGVETPDGFQKLAPGRLTASTINRHLRRLGYDHERMIRQPPAVRFQAEKRECAVAFRHEPVGPEASEDAGLDRSRTGRVRLP